MSSGSKADDILEEEREVVSMHGEQEQNEENSSINHDFAIPKDSTSNNAEEVVDESEVQPEAESLNNNPFNNINNSDDTKSISSFNANADTNINTAIKRNNVRVNFVRNESSTDLLPSLEEALSNARSRSSASVNNSEVAKTIDEDDNDNEDILSLPNNNSISEGGGVELGADEGLAMSPKRSTAAVPPRSTTTEFLSRNESSVDLLPSVEEVLSINSANRNSNASPAMMATSSVSRKTMHTNNNNSSNIDNDDLLSVLTEDRPTVQFPNNTSNKYGGATDEDLVSVLTEDKTQILPPVQPVVPQADLLDLPATETTTATTQTQQEQSSQSQTQSVTTDTPFDLLSSTHSQSHQSYTQPQQPEPEVDLLSSAYDDENETYQEQEGSVMSNFDFQQEEDFLSRDLLDVPVVTEEDEDDESEGQTSQDFLDEARELAQENNIDEINNDNFSVEKEVEQYHEDLLDIIQNPNSCMHSIAPAYNGLEPDQKDGKINTKIRSIKELPQDLILQTASSSSSRNQNLFSSCVSMMSEEHSYNDDFMDDDDEEEDEGRRDIEEGNNRDLYLASTSASMTNVMCDDSALDSSSEYLNQSQYITHQKQKLPQNLEWRKESSTAKLSVVSEMSEPVGNRGANEEEENDILGKKDFDEDNEDEMPLVLERNGTSTTNNTDPSLNYSDDEEEGQNISSNEHSNHVPAIAMPAIMPTHSSASTPTSEQLKTPVASGGGTAATLHFLQRSNSLHALQGSSSRPRTTNNTLGLSSDEESESSSEDDGEILMATPRSTWKRMSQRNLQVSALGGALMDEEDDDEDLEDVEEETDKNSSTKVEKRDSKSYEHDDDFLSNTQKLEAEVIRLKFELASLQATIDSSTPSKKQTHKKSKLGNIAEEGEYDDDDDDTSSSDEDSDDEDTEDNEGEKEDTQPQAQQSFWRTLSTRRLSLNPPPPAKNDPDSNNDETEDPSIALSKLKKENMKLKRKLKKQKNKTKGAKEDISELKEQLDISIKEKDSLSLDLWKTEEELQRLTFEVQDLHHNNNSDINDTANSILIEQENLTLKTENRMLYEENKALVSKVSSMSFNDDDDDDDDDDDGDKNEVENSSNINEKSILVEQENLSLKTENRMLYEENKTLLSKVSMLSEENQEQKESVDHLQKFNDQLQIRIDALLMSSEVNESPKSHLGKDPRRNITSNRRSVMSESK